MWIGPTRKHVFVHVPESNNENGKNTMVFIGDIHLQILVCFPLATSVFGGLEG